MKRKFILLPITLTALAPAISLVGCSDPDTPEPTPTNKIIIDTYQESLGEGKTPGIHSEKIHIKEDEVYNFVINFKNFVGFGEEGKIRFLYTTTSLETGGLWGIFLSGENIFYINNDQSKQLQQGSSALRDGDYFYNAGGSFEFNKTEKMLSLKRNDYLNGSFKVRATGDYYFVFV